MFAYIEQRITRYQQIRTQRRMERAARAAVQLNLRNARFRFCPGCQVPIEKNEGCDHMRCAICRLDFSWRAAVPCNLDVLDNTGDGRWRFCPFCRYQNQKLHCLADARCARCLRDFKWEDALFVPVTTIRAPVWEAPSHSAPPVIQQPMPGTPQHDPREPRPQPPQQQVPIPTQSVPQERPVNTTPQANNTNRAQRRRPRRMVWSSMRRSNVYSDNVHCGAARQPQAQMSAALRHWLNDARRLKMLEQMQEIPLEASTEEVTGDSAPEESVPELLRCEICATRKKSFALPCGHLFCEHCLVTYLREHPICPVDRSAVQVPPIKIYF